MLQNLRGSNCKGGSGILFLLLSLWQAAWSAPAFADSIDAATLIQKIKSEIQEVRKLKTEPKLEIKSVKIDLKTVAERDAEGGFKFSVPIVPISGNVQAGGHSETVHLLSLEFEPAGALEISSETSLGLADAVKSVKLAIQAAMSSEPQFKAVQARYEANFELKADAKGGFSFWFLELGNVEIAKMATQHIEIEFTPPLE